MKSLAVTLSSFSLAVAAAAVALAGCGGAPGVDTASSSAADDTTSSSKSHSCTVSTECESGDYCATASGASCSASGTCKPLPFACPQICAPVCGCDGNTYDNYCEAEQASVNPAFEGFCEKSPATGCWGGYGGQSCTPATAQNDCNPNGSGDGYRGTTGDSDLYCAGSGCATIPAGCKTEGEVCGTDGNTYDGECKAYWDGRVGVASKGACETSGDADADDGGSSSN